MVSLRVYCTISVTTPSRKPTSHPTPLRPTSTPPHPSYLCSPGYEKDVVSGQCKSCEDIAAINASAVFAMVVAFFMLILLLTTQRRNVPKYMRRWLSLCRFRVSRLRIVKSLSNLFDRADRIKIVFTAYQILQQTSWTLPGVLFPSFFVTFRSLLGFTAIDFRGVLPLKVNATLEPTIRPSDHPITQLLNHLTTRCPLLSPPTSTYSA